MLHRRGDNHPINPTGVALRREIDGIIDQANEFLIRPCLQGNLRSTSTTPSACPERGGFQPRSVPRRANSLGCAPRLPWICFGAPWNACCHSQLYLRSFLRCLLKSPQNRRRDLRLYLVCVLRRMIECVFRRTWERHLSVPRHLEDEQSWELICDRVPQNRSYGPLAGGRRPQCKPPRCRRNSAKEPSHES